MDKTNRKEVTLEWDEIIKRHPSFARVFLAQQVILMEASDLGFRFIDLNMCQLLATKLPVLFEDFWRHRCPPPGIRGIRPSEIWDCLIKQNRDPAECFKNDDPEGWFDDPFEGGKTLPPIPPVPPLK